MAAARTAEHCAELSGARPLAVKRVARALEAIQEVDLPEHHSSHERLAAASAAMRIMKAMA